MNFDSLDSFGSYVGTRVPKAMRGALEQELKVIGQAIKKDAVKSVGTYQSGIGPFPAWAPLAASTVARKGHNKPLLETGELKRSISTRVVRSQMAVHIGTNNKKAEFNEYGSGGVHPIPPRPIFGPAALRVLPKMLPRLGQACVAGFGVRLSTTTPGVSGEGRFQF